VGPLDGRFAIRDEKMSLSGKHLLGILTITLACTAHASDLELTTPDGRRVLLKDDKTWRYVDGEATKDAKAADAQKTKDAGEALLSLEGRIAGNRVCRFQLKLVNNLPYQIRSLVPEFSVYRDGNVVYDSVFSGFAFVKPGDSQQREVRFNGIACEEVTRVQVGGGDRCEMGDLDKFSAGKGKCLSLVRVLASEVVRFDK
jgi:hypothetical protein